MNKKLFKQIFLFLLLATIIWIAMSVYLAISSGMLYIVKRYQNDLESFLSMVRSEYALLSETEKGYLHTQSDSSTCLNYLVFEENEMIYGYIMESKLTEITAPPNFTKLQSEWKKLSGGKLESVGIRFQEDGTLHASFTNVGKWISYEEGKYRYINSLIWYDEDNPGRPKKSWEQLQGHNLYKNPEMGNDWWILLTEENGITPSTDGDWYYSSRKQYDG